MRPVKSSIQNSLKGSLKQPPRPFLKWAGGKTQLVQELINHLPDSIDRYFEPFLGGGALFFTLQKIKVIEKAYLSDLNDELITTYIAIRDNVQGIIKLLKKYEKQHSPKFFYEMRLKSPRKPEHIATRMIYLNKTCYNGLYRVNSQGKFNVPMGNYKSPKICDEENLMAVSKALKNVQIVCRTFEDAVKKARKNDLVYFDPPYEPVSKTANFTSYQPEGFNRDSQKKLQEVCQKLTQNEVKVMLSNSSADSIMKLYKRNGFYIHRVKAIRAINSNPHRRGKLTELIVTNYDCKNQNDELG